MGLPLLRRPRPPQLARIGAFTFLLWVSLASLPTEGAVASPVRSRIAFAAIEGVSTADPAGGPAQLIVGPTGTGVDHVATSPKWSPDGSWIAYVRGWALWVVRPDGSDNHRLLHEFRANLPRWSADSRYVYFTVFPGGPNTYVYSVGVDGSPGPWFGNPTGQAESLATWSPDGTRVAFTSRGADGRYRVYTMNASGSDLRAITSGQTDDNVQDWSPDGRKLLIHSSSENFERVDAVVIDADGGNRRVVRQHAVPRSWSPDGRRILFEDLVNRGLKHMAADGTGVVSLPGMGASADWGPGSVDQYVASPGWTDPTPSTSVSPPVQGPPSARGSTDTSLVNRPSTMTRRSGSSADQPASTSESQAGDTLADEQLVTDQSEDGGGRNAAGLGVETTDDGEAVSRHRPVLIAGVLLATVIGLGIAVSVRAARTLLRPW